MTNGHFDEKKLNQILQGNLHEGADGMQTYTPTPEHIQARDVIQKIPFFTFMGFSLGLGYAHPSSGDTVVSSMIGGMLSVQNGDFHMNTGDAVQWYFSFEKDIFDRHGRRRSQPETLDLKKDQLQRRATHMRENG
eukprot:130335-Rhodomonas_salina.1